MSDCSRENYFWVYKCQQHNKSPIAQGSAQNSEELPEKMVKNIIRKNKYLYIDMIEQNKEQGIREMQKIEATKAKKYQLQKIGKKDYLCGVANLSPQSQKGFDYLDNQKEFERNQHKIRSLFKKNLDLTIPRHIQKGKTKTKCQLRKQAFSLNKIGVVNQEDNVEALSQSPNNHFKSIITIDVGTTTEKNSSVYRGIRKNKLSEHLRKKEAQNINEMILRKEKFLIKKYGLTNDYQSVTKQRSPIVRDNRDTRRIYLPQIKSDPYL